MPKIFRSINDIVALKGKGQNKLGSGSFSEVNLVCHRSNPRKLYAMKVVATRTERDRKLVFKEIKLHMGLEHPNVIKFEDYLELPDKILIFLEFAKNGDLFKFFHSHKLTESQLLRIFYQTCLAIQYIHNKNVMHRDLKPENILLDEQMNVKVCDFGWSAEYFENVKRETLCGTYEYMAPEVFFRNKQTKKTDIWSLGILLFELFHGYAPFRGTRMDQVMDNIMKNVVAFKKNVNGWVRELVIKMLIFDPERRPTIDQVLQDKLLLDYIKKVQPKVYQKENKTMRSVSPKIGFMNKLNPKMFNDLKRKNNMVITERQYKKEEFNQSFNSNNSFLKKSDVGKNNFKKKKKPDHFSIFKKVHNPRNQFTNSFQKPHHNPSNSQVAFKSNRIFTSNSPMTKNYQMNRSFNVNYISQRTLEISNESSFSRNYNKSNASLNSPFLHKQQNTLYQHNSKNYKSGHFEKRKNFGQKFFGTYLNNKR